MLSNNWLITIIVYLSGNYGWFLWNSWLYKSDWGDNNIIDGCLILIRGPDRDEHLYVCHKGFHGIKVMAVCDAHCCFTQYVYFWQHSIASQCRRPTPASRLCCGYIDCQLQCSRFCSKGSANKICIWSTLIRFPLHIISVDVFFFFSFFFLSKK